MGWHTESSRTVYENRWIHVREDAVVGPGGPGIYGVVRMQQPSVFVVAVDEHDRMCLVTLERYPSGLTSLEVPSGGSDGEDPLRAAQRELREESGYEARSWEPLGRMFALNGIADAPEHVFLARELFPSSRADAHDQSEEGIEAVSWVPFGEVLEMIGDGRITDGESIAAVLYAAIRLGRAR